jgi:tetratricopeptide (TPR) repeat protein
MLNPMIRLARAFHVLLLCAVAIASGAAETTASLIERTYALATKKDFSSAERTARVALAQSPGSHDATLALARVLMWDGRFLEAVALFERLLKSNPADGDARLGLAQAEYWSGDYRSALRDFRAVSERPEAARAIAEIEAASAPGYVVHATASSDDQPYRGFGIDAEAYAFSDPLTRWSVGAGSNRYSARDRHATTPALSLGAESFVTPLRSRVQAALTWFRFPDRTTSILPALSVSRASGKTRWTLEARREALLASATALHTHPTADTLSLRWEDPARFALHAEERRYFDRNRGRGVDGYYLHNIGEFAVGASAAWRDTDESRFFSGSYDPYYTPQNMREARVVTSW